MCFIRILFLWLCWANHQCFYYRFPLKNPSLLNSWVMAMKRDHWKPTQYSFLCEKHFTPDDYVMGSANKLKKYLKPDAIPTVFDFPSHLTKETNPRKSPMKRKATSTVPDVPKKRTAFNQLVMTTTTVHLLVRLSQK